MRPKLSTGLSGLAVILSLGALLVSLSTASRSASERPGASSFVPSPRYMPAQLHTCRAEVPLNDLSDVMVHGFNHNLSVLSFLLFHDRSEMQVRMEKISDTAGTMLGCVSLAAGLEPDVGLQDRVQYYVMLQNLQHDLVASQLAAQELDEQGVARWFHHIKRDCVMCHAFFRPSDEQ